MGSIPVGGAIYKRHRFCDAFYRSYARKNELNPSKRSFETFALSVTTAQRIFGRKSGFRFPLGVPFIASAMPFIDRMLKNELNPSKRSFETFALSVTTAQRIFGRKSGFRFPLGVPQAVCITFVERFFISIAETDVILQTNSQGGIPFRETLGECEKLA